MSRAITGAADNRSSKRLLFLALVLATLSAGLVYVTISRNAKSDSSAASVGGATVPVVVASERIEARSIIDASQLSVRQFPTDLAPDAAARFSSVDELTGKVAALTLAPGEEVLKSKIVGVEEGGRPESLSSAVQPDMRAMSISVSQVVSAGGLILPGDYVDIIGTFNVKTPDSEYEKYFGRTILENVQVMAVDQKIASVPLPADTQPSGTPTATAGGKTSSGGSAEAEATTMTLLVTPQQALWLFFAEQKGTLRAIVRSYGDGKVTTTDAVPPSATGAPNRAGYVYDNDLFPSGMPLPAAAR